MSLLWTPRPNPPSLAIPPRPTWRNRRSLVTDEQRREVEAESAADFKRMLAKPRGPEFWTKERSAKVTP